jgi:hypothetical protein
MAWLSARRRWASARASGPVIHCDEPSAAAVGRRRPAVERRRQLEDHPRSAGPAVVEVGLELLGHLGPQATGLDGDTGVAEAGEPGPGDERVGIGHGHHDPADPGLDQGVGARAGPPGVGARLEGDVGDGAARLGLAAGGPGRVEGDDLGVAASRGLGGTGVDRPVGRDDHGADPRVGGGAGPDGRGELDGGGHALLVGRLGHRILPGASGSREERQRPPARAGPSRRRVTSLPSGL